MVACEGAGVAPRELRSIARADLADGRRALLRFDQIDFADATVHGHFDILS
jgi:hypothetical protein